MGTHGYESKDGRCGEEHTFSSRASAVVIYIIIIIIWSADSVVTSSEATTVPLYTYV